MSNTRNTNRQTTDKFKIKAFTNTITRRRVVTTGASMLAGVTATSIPILVQTPATSAKENYTDKEHANLEAMKSYFDGLKARNVSGVRFAPDIIFTTVILPRPVSGEAAVRQLTADFANKLVNVRVDRYIIDGDFGCARFEIDWPENVVAHSIDYMTFANGQIKSIEVYWDPRAFLAWQQRQQARRT